MNRLIFPSSGFDQLRKQLILEDDPREHCAILLAHRARTATGCRFLVTRHFVAPPEAFRIRKRHAAVLHPEFVADVAKQARGSGQSLIFVHTHPDSDLPSFSNVDDVGEQHISEFIHRRLGDQPHAALVLGKQGCKARILGTRDEGLKVSQLSGLLETYGTPCTSRPLSTAYDRQIRAFGSSGQELIQGLRIGIVGLGGTGSIVLDMLARLGVNKLVLVDPDTVEASNLNRLVGSNPGSVGLPKVEVARAHASNIHVHSSEILAIQGSVLDSASVEPLKSVDFIFGCTDSHSSRAVLNQLAYQYLIPCIDLGVSIAADDGAVKSITGRVQYLAPGFGCLVCGGQMDYDAVRREFMNEAQRIADPYFVGEGVPQPSVVSINGTVASLAVTMFLSIVTDIPSNPRFLFYDGIAGKLRSVAAARDLSCLVCSTRGALARGDSMELPLRKL